MKPATLLTIFWFGFLAILSPTWAGAAPLSTAFTYQGQLKQNGNPINNTADFQFTLWNANSGPTQVAGPMAVNGVSVANGLFTVQIDFGSDVFNGDSRWLEIAVRSPAGSGSFTTLSPRQPLSAVPYALQTRGLFTSSAGNVGIGTSSPVEKLTVAGSMEIGIGAGDYEHLRIGGGNSSGFLYGSYPQFGDGIHLGYNYYADATGAHQVINPGGGSSRISVGYGSIDLCADSCPGCVPAPVLLHVAPFTSYFFSTNLGLDTLNPNFMLHVNGTAGKPGGGSWSNSSDIRLKKNIEPLHGALDQLLCLQGVTFEYIDPDAIDELPGPRIGMIAQEVEQVFPDWVGKRIDGFKSVTYRGFEALTVEALRDLRAEKNAQIESLQAEKDADIALLRARVDALELALQTLVANQNGGAR
jgi:hypothetical protein